MGNGNTAIGYSSLHRNTTGSYNTALGFNSTNYNNLDNTTSIGFGASVTSSNQVRIGNNAINSIGGHVAWSTFSDGRVKKNIRTDVPGLAFINSLQPVTYNMDLDAIDELMKFEEPEIRDDDMEAPPPKSQEMIEIERKAREAKEKIVQTGFVAQDVEKAAKEAGYDFSGVDVDEIGIYSLRYAEFVVPLVKAVQELSEQNDRLKEQINELNRRLEILENK